MCVFPERKTGKLKSARWGSVITNRAGVVCDSQVHVGAFHGLASGIGQMIVL